MKTEHDHQWIDITRINSPDWEFMCADCSAYMIEPRGEWPLYPFILRSPNEGTHVAWTPQTS